MLVLKLELWPHGDEAKAKEIGRTYIANVGGSQTRGDYIAAVCRQGTTAVPKEIYQGNAVTTQPPAATRSARVENYPRLSYNVWRLIIRALLGCFPEERK